MYTYMLNMFLEIFTKNLYIISRTSGICKTKFEVQLRFSKGMNPHLPAFYLTTSYFGKKCFGASMTRWSTKDGVAWFGFSSFNGISTFVGNLMPTPSLSKNWNLNSLTMLSQFSTLATIMCGLLLPTKSLG